MLVGCFMVAYCLISYFIFTISILSYFLSLKILSYYLINKLFQDVEKELENQEAEARVSRQQRKENLHLHYN